MELTVVVQDIHRLNHQLELFERKYSMMSRTFYEEYCAGQEPEDDDWVLDFAEWAGLYETWRDRQMSYAEIVDRLRQNESSLFQQIQSVAA
jgi:hypothetical protein